MKTCLSCGSSSVESAKFCSRCGAKLERGLAWNMAILVSLGAGLALILLEVFLVYVVDPGADPGADIRSQLNTTIFLAAVVCVAVLWFSWLRFSVKRWRIRRAQVQGREYRPGLAWYVAIPASLGIGVAVFVTNGGVSVWDDVFWAAVFSVAALWFSWLRFSVKRWRIRRAADETV